MIAIIAGGRRYQFTEKDERFLDSLDITLVIHGGARGADTCAMIWATKRKIPYGTFYADWSKYGRSAGPRRNLEMAKYLHELETEKKKAVVLFPGGRGTANMREQAKIYSLPIIEVRK
jgi:hypothetical protein